MPSRKSSLSKRHHESKEGRYFEEHEKDSEELEETILVVFDCPDYVKDERDTQESGKLKTEENLYNVANRQEWHGKLTDCNDCTASVFSCT